MKISETKAVKLNQKQAANFVFKMSVTHPPTLGNLLLQVCRCYDQQADGLQRIKQCLLQTGHMRGQNMAVY